MTVCQCSCLCQRPPAAYDGAIICDGCIYSQQPSRAHVAPSNLDYARVRAEQRVLAAARQLDPAWGIEAVDRWPQLCDVFDHPDYAPLRALHRAAIELQEAEASESAGTSSGTSTGRSQVGSSASDPPR